MLKMTIYNTSTLNKYRRRESENLATEKKQQQVLTNEIIYWVQGGIELNYDQEGQMNLLRFRYILYCCKLSPPQGLGMRMSPVCCSI